jgi:hypothetical protein
VFVGTFLPITVRVPRTEQLDGGEKPLLLE